MPPDTDKLAAWHMQFQAALERVRAGADIMPRGQLESVISAELGSEWRSKLREFDDEPLAAASIGQVCRGTTGRLAPQLTWRWSCPGCCLHLVQEGWPHRLHANDWLLCLAEPARYSDSTLLLPCCC